MRSRDIAHFRRKGWAYWLMLSLCFLNFSLVFAEEHASRPLEKQRPEASEQKPGPVDITVRFNGFESFCQATPIMNRPLEEPKGVCRLIFATAAHCLYDKQNQFFSSILIPGLGRIPRGSRDSSGEFQVNDGTLHAEVSGEYVQSLSQGGLSQSETRPGDSAVLIYDGECEKTGHLIPIRVAPAEETGTTEIDSAKLTIPKRKEPVSNDRGGFWNKGGGKHFVADFEGKKNSKGQFEAHIPSPQGVGVGDSGGPIWNTKGELVGMISGGKGTKVVFDSKAAGFLEDQLNKHGRGEKNNSDLAKETLPEKRERTQETESSHPASNRPSPNIYNGVEFSANDSKSLESKPVGAQESPEAMFLLKTKDGLRKAAFKDAEGKHVVAPDNYQEALKQYYETHGEEVGQLSEPQQRYVKEFLSGFNQPRAAKEVLPEQKTQESQETHDSKPDVASSKEQRRRGPVREGLAKALDWLRRKPQTDKSKSEEARDPFGKLAFEHVPQTTTSTWSAPVPANKKVPTLEDIYNHRSRKEGGVVYVNGQKRSIFSEDAGTVAHELGHGIHSALEEQRKGHAAMYVPGKGAVYVKKPNVDRVAAGRYVPAELRGIDGNGGRFSSYIQTKNGGIPDAGTPFDSSGRRLGDANVMYIWDELAAYSIGGEAALEAERSKGPQRSDYLTGPAEFSVYALASMMATKDRDPRYYASEDFTQMKRAYAFMAERAVNLVNQGQGTTLSPEKSVRYFERLRTARSKEAQQMRSFLKSEFGSAWTERVFGF